MFNAVDHIQLFNQLKAEAEKSSNFMSFKEVQELLKKCECPISKMFVQALVNQKILKRLPKSTNYVFIHKDPIYHGQLQAAYSRFHSQTSGYNKVTRRNKDEQVKANEVADAVKLLEEKGYVIKNTQALSFEEALQALYNGKKVSRKVWKTSFLWLKPAVLIQESWCKDELLKSIVSKNGGQIEALPCICKLTSDNKILSGWTPNTEDLFTDDWKILD